MSKHLVQVTLVSANISGVKKTQGSLFSQVLLCVFASGVLINDKIYNSSRMEISS